MTTQNLKNIINHYRKWKRVNPDTWVEHCVSQKDLKNTIIYAALSENHLGKRNAHQKRLKKLNLEKFSSNLVNNIKKIENALTFDELLKIVERYKTKGVGELTCYDAANRIGAKLGLSTRLNLLTRRNEKGSRKADREKIERQVYKKGRFTHYIPR
jgi:hypothetical protein